jgi:hypothetical protein
MSTTRNIGITVAAAALLLAAVANLCAAPPQTLTVGGAIQASADGTSPGGAVWQVYGVSESGKQLDGTVGVAAPGLWLGDFGSKSDALVVGMDCLVVVSKTIGDGALGRTGYYAVVNHTLAGNDPAEFPEMTLRPIPVPDATADTHARLIWNAAVEDAGEGGETNILGYTVHRSLDGQNFTVASDSIVTDTQYDDDIPNDGEYVYAIGLVYRGDPPVTGAVLSARSPRVFKDSDGDGLPDYFKIANDLQIGSGDPADGPDGDPDNDGMTNYEHWISGTRANDKDSYFAVESVVPDGDGFTIQWDGVAERWYSVYRSSQLASNDWTRIYGPTYCPANQAMEHTDSPEVSAPHFYRLKVSRD